MSEVKNEILRTLKDAEDPIHMREIAERTNYSRKTIEKYMPLLAAEGKAECVATVGNAKLFDLTENAR
ncbi:MAG: HTH domain-containing protein [Halobacteriaceae archaeon]